MQIVVSSRNAFGMYPKSKDHMPIDLEQIIGDSINDLNCLYANMSKIKLKIKWMIGWSVLSLRPKITCSFLYQGFSLGAKAHTSLNNNLKLQS